MKKVLFVLAAIACMLSCRSVKKDGSIATHHYSSGADTLALVSIAEKSDSSKYLHMVIDSLSTELLSIRQEYRNLYVSDSVNETASRRDSVHVKDTTWLQINQDGTVTYYTVREKSTYTSQQLERYRQQIVKESEHTIDSLIEQNCHLLAMYDSLSTENRYLNDVMAYKAYHDSISDITSEKEMRTIYKNSIWDKVKVAIITAAFLVFLYVVVIVYIKFIRPYR